MIGRSLLSSYASGRSDRLHHQLLALHTTPPSYKEISSPEVFQQPADLYRERECVLITYSFSAYMPKKQANI